MVEDESRSPEQERRFQGGLKFRKRDDHAIELFGDAKASLGDPERVKRILLELGRYYNPYVDQPIVDPDTRRRVVELLEGGHPEEASRLLDERLSLYAGRDRPEEGEGR